MYHKILIDMKTTTPSDIGLQKRAIQLPTINLPRILAVVIIISLCLVLLYNSLYWWSIGVLLVSFGAIRIYNLYREFNDFDWSIDIPEITMEEVMGDLENR